MIREIGSEFCRNPQTKLRNKFKPLLGESCFLDSGRSAIRTIISDIKAQRGDFKVYMPDYCCDSMLLPFIEAGIEICFYAVFVNQKGIAFNYDLENGCEVVFLMNYFGFRSEQLEELVSLEKQRGKTVIYDATQAVFAPFPKADYVFGSFRKWFYSFSCLLNKSGEFTVSLPDDINSEYILLKTSAAQKKAAYLDGEQTEKKEFLDLFAHSEEVLEDQNRTFAGLRDDFEHIDFKFICEARRRNAEILMNGIKKLNIEQISPIFQKIGACDIPLFVPVTVKEKRCELRKAFMANDIYLPIHWPVSPLHSKANYLYDSELSLVCDQRYDCDDMHRILNVLKEFYWKR